MSYDNHRFQSTLHRFLGLLRYTLPLGFVALTGCVSAIKSIARSEVEGLSNAPPPPPAPSRKADAYESPIPRWNSAYQGATTNQNPGDKKRLARAYRTLDVADGVRESLAGIGNPYGSVQLTPLAISFCMAGGVPHRREKDWWGNAFSLQPGGLASSIFEGRLKDRCELSYRRSH